ncbi:MAG: hypothetical protein U1F30_16150 [Steroidobacteraceae bacterium]
MMTIERPVSTACTPYSTGARNMKVNSIGSVTPVRNEVRPIESSRPPVARRCPGRAQRYMARQAPGRPNIITGKKPAMNAPADGSPAKKRLRSPVTPWKSPSRNQAMLLRMWCKPVTMSTRLSVP